jgi:hypothetical protein
VQRQHGPLRGNEVSTDLVGKLQLGGVLGGVVADDLAGVDDAPEGAGAAGDPVEDPEWDAVLIGLRESAYTGANC